MRRKVRLRVALCIMAVMLMLTLGIYASERGQESYTENKLHNDYGDSLYVLLHTNEVMLEEADCCSELANHEELPLAISEAPLFFTDLGELLAGVGLAKFSEFAIFGIEPFNSDFVDVRSFNVLQDLSNLFMPASVRSDFEMFGITVRSSDTIAFLHGDSIGNMANFIWSRSISPANATRDFFGRGAIAEYVITRNGIDFYISEWVRSVTREPDGWVVAWAQSGQAFMASLPANYSLDDVLAFCDAVIFTSWELEGNAVSVSIEGLENVRIYERATGRSDFGEFAAHGASGNEIIAIGNTLYRIGLARELEAVGYRWLIDYASQRYQYVLRPGEYEFHITGVTEQPELLVQHFALGERVSVVDFSAYILENLEYEINLFVSGEPEDNEIIFIEGPPQNQGLTGNGTAVSPFIISTASNLAYMAERVNAADPRYTHAYYRLANDIDLSSYGAGWNDGRGWIPIGRGNIASGAIFAGVFDGNGRSITNFYMNYSSGIGRAEDAKGLFGIVTGTIRCLRIEGTVFSSVTHMSMGGVAGTLLYGSIVNVQFYGSVTTAFPNSFVGGVAGIVHSGSIMNSSTMGIIDGGIILGGIAGAVFLNTESWAGISPADSPTVIANNTSTATVRSYVGFFAGGIAGIIGEDAHIVNNHALNPLVQSLMFTGRVVGNISAASPVLNRNLALVTMSSGTGFFHWPPCIYNNHDNLNGADFDPNYSIVLIGNGTSDVPFLILSSSDLAYMAERVNAADARYTHAHFRLVNDIDLSNYGASWNDGRGWVPIGAGNLVDGRIFQGVFDGGNHKITGLYMNHPLDIGRITEAVGLFGFVTGTVRNLYVEGSIISGITQIGTGGIAGAVLNGEADNVHFSGIILQTRHGENTGGVVGVVQSSSVLNSSSSGTVDSGFGQGAGGVVGNSGFTFAGGADIVSPDVPSFVINNTSTAFVNGGAAVGGIIGLVERNIYIESNFAFNPMVQGTIGVGRVVGILARPVAVLSENQALVNMSYGTGMPFHSPAHIYNVHNNLNGENFALYSSNVLIGSGTVTDPFIISTASDLAHMAARVNMTDRRYSHAHFLLANTINLSAYGASWNGGRGWIPIGIGYPSRGDVFHGVFDGAGNSINGLYVNLQDNHDGSVRSVGLFGTITGTVRNINVNGTVTSGTVNMGTGGIVGTNIGGVVENNIFTGTISQTGWRGNTGGIVGVLQNGVVKDNTFRGWLFGNGAHAGGIVGASGISVFGSHDWIMADPYARSIISGNVSEGGVEGNNFVGGVAGHIAFSTELTNNLATSLIVQGNLNVGRVVGGVGSTSPLPTLYSNRASVLMSHGFGIAFRQPPDVFNRHDRENGEDMIPQSDMFAGAGTADDPFRVYVTDQLMYLAWRVNAADVRYTHAYFILQNSIDLSEYGANWNGGRGWIPIGTGSPICGTFFQGVFDGNNNVITGLYINQPNVSWNSVGLFGTITGTVRNLAVHGTIISNTAHMGTGGIVGTSLGGTIENNYFYGTVYQISSGVGTGGIVGIVHNGIVQNNMSEGKIHGNGARVGGIVGASGISVHVGGVSINADPNTASIITNNMSTATVIGNNAVGGIAGFVIFRADLTYNWAFNPLVQGNSSIGRVAGSVNNANPQPILSGNIAIAWMSYGSGIPFPGPPEVFNRHDRLNGADFNLTRQAEFGMDFADFDWNALLVEEDYIATASENDYGMYYYGMYYMYHYMVEEEKTHDGYSLEGDEY